MSNKIVLISLADKLTPLEELLIKNSEYEDINLTHTALHVFDQRSWADGVNSCAGIVYGTAKALEELVEYDVPLEICEQVIDSLTGIVDTLLAEHIDNDVPSNITISSIGRYEYSIGIHTYDSKREIIKPQIATYGVVNVHSCPSISDAYSTRYNLNTD